MPAATLHEGAHTPIGQHLEHGRPDQQQREPIGRQPTGRQNVNSASKLCVCQRAIDTGASRPKSGTMLPMTAAVNMPARDSSR